MIQIAHPKSKERKSLKVEDVLKLTNALRREDLSGRVLARWLGLATGIRRGEALGLFWKHVDLDRKQICIAQQLAYDKTLREPKSENSRRWIGIDDETTDLSGTKHTKRSGYRGYNFHELRHTQATLLIGSGADNKTVQACLGHSSASLTTNIYAHAIAANDRTTADTIGNTVFANTSEGQKDKRKQ